MMTITKSELEKSVDRLNLVLGKPTQPYVKNGDMLLPQEGHYFLDWAYGGVKLSQMCGGGGCRDISVIRGTKRECYYQIQAALAIITQERLCDA